MGLFKKIAVEAAKKAVEYVAMDAISGNNKVANQIISDIKNSNDEKIVEKACNRALFRIKQFSSIDDIDTQTIVVNQDGDFYYSITKKDYGKEYILNDECGRENVRICCSDAWYSSINIHDRVRLHMSLKGFYYDSTLNHWTITSNVLGNKYYFANGEHAIAEVDIKLIGEDYAIMYINNGMDFRDVLLIFLAIDTINKYRNELSEENARKQEKVDYKKSKKKSRKNEGRPLKSKINWSDILFDNRAYPEGDYDDDND